MARKPSTLPNHLQHGRLSTYILVDGQSEQYYFKSLKTTENITATIEPDLLVKKSLESQYNTVVEALNHYDHVIWLVDYDVIYKESLEQTKNKSDQLFLQYKTAFEALIAEPDYEDKIAKVLINNPCIEYWYLQHYDSTQHHFINCAQVEAELKKHLSGYKKKKDYQQGMYTRLKSELNLAIVNARGINRDDSDIKARADMVDIFNLFNEKFGVFKDLEVYKKSI